METRTVQFIRKRNYQTIAKDKVVRLRSVVLEQGSARPFVVTAIDADNVTVDGNHPLAGKDLRFLLEVLDIRDASRAELDAGHAFGLSG